MSTAKGGNGGEGDGDGDDIDADVDGETGIEGKTNSDERERENSMEYFPNYHPIKNTNKRFTIIAEENAKEALKELNMKREIHAQRLAKLYCAGSDSEMIKTDIQRREQKEVKLNLDKYQSSFSMAKVSSEPIESADKRLFQMTDSLLHSTKQKHIREPPRQSSTIYNQYSQGDWKEKIFSKAQTENHSHLRTHAALSLFDQFEENPGTTNMEVSPYSTKFLAEPQKSAHTTTTPLEWKINEKRNDNEQYVKSLVAGQSVCSKIAGKSPDSLTSLQSTLMACGQLVTPDLQEKQRIESKVRQSLLTDGVRLSKQHAQWLLTKSPRAKLLKSSSKSKSTLAPMSSSISSHNNSHPSRWNPSSSSPGAEAVAAAVVGGGVERSRGNKTSHIKGSLLENDLDEPLSRSLVDEEYQPTKSNKPLPRSKKSLALQSQQLSTYEGSLASHLHTETKDTTANPFRLKERDSKIHLSASKSLSSLQNRQVDPKSYSNDSIMANYGEYAVSIKEPYVTGVPSVDKVNKALVQLSRRMIVCYDTKVVETGAALKALQDIRHPTPGIAAIVDLNRAFCDAASFNPSSWQLSRQQFEQILSEKVPWLEKTSISRLASAYDPHRSGVIKFVRVAAALMVGNRPAMSILMAQLTRDPDNIDKTGNVFLLRLLHGLYEDCDGGVVEQAISSLERPAKGKEALNIQKTEGVGVKLEDIGELLSAACTCLEDEIEMQRLAAEVVQVLFEEGQRKDLAAIPSSNSRINKRPFTRSTRREMLLFGETAALDFSTEGEEEDLAFDYTLPSAGSNKPIAKVVLKHSTLKGVRSIPSVNQNDFVKCVTRHPSLMTVFDRQLTRFRELMLPYVTKGTISFEKSLHDKSMYGSRAYH